MLGNARQTLVSVAAITKVLRLVSSIALTKLGMSQALICPCRATYLACGATWWMSGISGPFGPSGTDAVVMTGIFSNVATLASAMTLRRRSLSLS